MSGQTPSQTIGPFFAYCLTPEDYGHNSVAGPDLTAGVAGGDHIEIAGKVLDGEGNGVSDAVVEIWQADSEGRYDSDTFRGFGRSASGPDGSFTFKTIKPGQVAGRGNSLQAPHITVAVFACGMLNHAFTRIYFSDETEANELDAVLQTVPAERRSTLLAEPDGTHFRFDIRLQGEAETVFFDA